MPVPVVMEQALPVRLEVEGGQRIPDHRPGEIALVGGEDRQHDEKLRADRLRPRCAAGGRCPGGPPGRPAITDRRGRPLSAGPCRPAPRRPRAGGSAGGGRSAAGGPDLLPGLALDGTEIAHVELPIEGGRTRSFPRVEHRKVVEIDQRLTLGARPAPARRGPPRFGGTGAARSR